MILQPRFNVGLRRGIFYFITVHFFGSGEAIRDYAAFQVSFGVQSTRLPIF